jgi:hypothetical protein
VLPVQTVIRSWFVFLRLRDEERTSEVAKHANECKLSAKNAQDASLKIYLCVWLKAKPTILPGTLLPIGGNRFLAAYVAPLGVEVRVQVRPHPSFQSLSSSHSSRNSQHRHGGPIS